MLNAFAPTNCPFSSLVLTELETQIADDKVEYHLMLA